MILDEIVNKTTERITVKKRTYPLESIKQEALRKKTVSGFAFEESLRKRGMSFICEVKKASPSKGIIAEEFPYLKIAREYEQAGAAAVSVLTEPFYFGGNDSFLSEIAKAVDIPVLRKDFVVDEYMIYEARLLGASAVLLIASILGEQLRDFIDTAHSLGLSALVEAHTAEEVTLALGSGARIIGVNNRNLHTFEVDTENSIRLKNLVTEDIIFVSESGIKTPQDIKKLKENGINAVLIGETLMRSDNKKEALQRLRGADNE
jgi:indole-3-glycerol phosphate synthase